MVWPLAALGLSHVELLAVPLGAFDFFVFPPSISFVRAA